MPSRWKNDAVGRGCVFISHSCNERRANDPPQLDTAIVTQRTDARTVRDAIAARLNATFGPDRVWYDTAVDRVGEDWEHAIVEALHTCHAAAILLTPESLQSAWVLREVIVLLDRKLRNPALVIVPIFLGGIRPSDINEHPLWSASRLTRIHGIEPIDEADADTTVERAVARLSKGVNEQQTIDQMPAWAKNITGPLGELAAGYSFRLDAAADAIGLRRPDRWDSAATTNLARLLATTPHEMPADPTQDPILLQAVLKLVDDVDVARPDGAEAKLCDYLVLAAAPAVTVIQLREATAAGPGQPIVLAVSDESLSDAEFDNQRNLARIVLRRAFAPDLRICPHTGVAGEHDEQLDPRARDEIRKWATTNRGYRNSTLPVVMWLDGVERDSVGQFSQDIAAAVSAEAAGTTTVVVVPRHLLPGESPIQPPGNASRAVAISADDEEYTRVVYDALHKMIPKEPP